MPRVKAKFTFAIPFTIRMLGEDVCQPFALEVGENRVVVYPPARWNEENRAYCWTEDPERPIGSVDDIPVWLADEVLIDVEREVESNTITQEDADNFLKTASDLLVRLLQTCRWRTQQTWIRADILPTSYNVRYFDEAGNWIRGGVADRAGAVVTKAIFGLPHLNSTMWDTICQDIASGAVPELWEELLLDAKEALLNQPRRAIIDTGAACEVFVELFCNKLANALGVDKDVYTELTPQRRPFPEYFHVVMRYLVKHSLKDEHPDIYKEITHLYKTASSVRHEGRCQYKKDDKKGTIVKVDAPRASSMIKAARSAIEWAKSLWNES